MAWAHSINEKVAKSAVGRWFRLDGSGHKKTRRGSNFLTEIRAGLATFFAMAYIIAVNSSIVADTGGTCICNGGADDPICETNTEYALCTNEIKRDLITATAAISCLASFAMGLFANLPVGLAPGMGLNAYFAYTVVGFHGTGTVPYQVAVTAIFVEGWIFFALALFGMRQWLARAIPRSIKLATSVGIGLFLTLIGLTYSEGIGLIVGATSTPTELAGCADGFRDPDTGLCPGSEKMRSPMMWVGIFCGGILTSLLLIYRVKGAILYGIILVSIISWPRTTPITYFPYTDVGNDNFDFFKKVVDFHQISKVLNVQEWSIGQYGGQFGLALITFLYVDILDCTGTLYSMAQYADLIDPVTQDFEGSTIAYMVDSVAISIGALLGTPPVTAFVESGAGIGEGGKTGLTAMVTGICFFISIFFAPIFASIPPWATGCVLVLVGSMMASSVTEINWRYPGDSIPAFVTIALMPFTYSIADGLIAGVCTYIVLNTTVWVLEKVSGGRIVPPNKDEKEPWTYKIPGGVLPPWMRRLAKGKKNFWSEDDRDEVVGRGEDSRRTSGSLGEPEEKTVGATTASKPVTEGGEEKLH
ncbi:inner membrane protein yico [Diaporthe amygdali]|uniref:inner membrane protein yico n=1 Tax=Phomopsis amygdali TaxID=1214568 RepID=UPI0022FECF8D|nr:inner membrane protein yico [Diaporthe amygdali]KAJ0123615.1 inner membrane protein yico [Diaporthe amygdali]